MDYRNPDNDATGMQLSSPERFRKSLHIVFSGHALVSSRDLFALHPGIENRYLADPALYKNLKFVAGIPGATFEQLADTFPQVSSFPEPVF